MHNKRKNRPLGGFYVPRGQVRENFNNQPNDIG